MQCGTWVTGVIVKTYTIPVYINDEIQAIAIQCLRVIFRYSKLILLSLLYIHTRNRLLNYEGSLMAFTGKSDKKENVTAAIAANIWMSHERGGRTALPDETLNFVVLDCLVSHLKIIIY